jgi:hypothetical protein
VKYAYLFLSILTSCTSLHGMKHTLNTSLKMYEVIDDLVIKIFTHATPVATWQENPHKISENLRIIAKTAAALSSTCPKFNILFCSNRIGNLMSIDDNNKNILLSYAAKNAIPALVQYAIAQKADVNYMYNYATPLIWSTIGNNYKCCSLLLNAKADPNIPSAVTTLCHVPKTLHPIDIAQLNNNQNIQELLYAFKANDNKIDKYTKKLLLKFLIDGNCTGLDIDEDFDCLEESNSDKPKVITFIQLK